MSPTGEQRSRICQTGRLGRVGAWLATFALLLQVVMPLAPAQAAMALDQEISASICHSSGAPEDAGAPAKAKGEHCQFCQIHMGAKILPPDPVAWIAPKAESRRAIGSLATHSTPGQSERRPQTQRGPPLHS